jgi:hypothetical protein
MVTVATRCAAEGRLRPTGHLVDAPASAARLARVVGWHIDHRAPRPGHLVAQHVCEAGPPRVRDAPRAPTSDHPRNVQLFQNDDAVALGESRRLDVQEVVALSPHLAVEAGDTGLGLISILGSFLSSADGALSVGEPLERGFQVAWASDPITVGSRGEVDDASVDSHDRAIAWGRLDRFDLADDRGEPLARVAAQRAGLWFALDRAVHHRAERAELGEADVGAVESPHLRVRLAEGQRVATPTLPPGRAREPLEATLPSLIELHEQLRADVARDVGEPRESSTKLGELVALVVRGQEDSLVPRSGQPEPSLLEGEVPEKTQGTFPRAEPLHLRGRRVDANAKSFADPHGPDRSLVYDVGQRLPHRQTRHIRTVRTLGYEQEEAAKAHAVVLAECRAHGCTKRDDVPVASGSRTDGKA